jgi:phospholipid/cholesterol/gamma-HCH transport system substrate-binding protein
MAREARKAVIGGFVVGAVALAVIGVIVLGSGKLFVGKRPAAVMFFPGSITGLSVGSPVLFKGARIGQVTRIAAVFDPADFSVAIPVYVEFDPNSLIVSTRHQSAIREGAELFTKQNLYQALLEKGLKAQLDVLSLVTGQLYVSLDFHPEMPAKLIGLEPQYNEIPTIPSLREQIVETMRDLPDKIMSATSAVEQLVESPAVQETMRNLASATRDLDLLVREVRAEVKPLVASVRGASDAAQRTLAQADRALSGNLGYDVSRTLGELDAAARAVRSLADYLERHPEAVLKGKR